MTVTLHASASRAGVQIRERRIRYEAGDTGRTEARETFSDWLLRLPCGTIGRAERASGAGYRSVLCGEVIWNQHAGRKQIRWYKR